AKFNELAFAYLREERNRTGIKRDLGSLTADDVKEITSFKRRLGLKPSVDFVPGTKSQVDVLRAADLSPDQSRRAILAELQGRFVDEIYAGGDASRIRKDFEEKGLADGMRQKEVDAMWFLPLGRVFGMLQREAEADPLHWGARAMLRLN